MMKKIVSLLLFSVALFSATPIKSDFKACFHKYKKSFVKIGAKRGIAVSKHTVLLFSKRYIRGYIKRDPFLGLYLFKTKKTLTPIKFTDFSKVKKIVGIISKDSYDIAKITSFSNGLEKATKLDKHVASNTIVSCVCCRAFGIGKGKNSFIDSDFIIRFLDNKRVVYADIGAKFFQKGSGIFVKEVNPFFKGLRLLPGDKIISVDGKRFADVSSLSKYILFSKPNRIVSVVYKRGSKVYKQKIKLQRKIAGGLIGQTYLENIGLWVGYDLKIHYLKRNSLASKLGLKKGDKLLKINDKFIHSHRDIKRALLQIKTKEIHLLFSRNDFQFFVHFRR